MRAVLGFDARDAVASDSRARVFGVISIDAKTFEDEREAGEGLLADL